MKDEHLDLLVDSDNVNVTNDAKQFKDDEFREHVVNVPDVGKIFNDEKEILEFCKRYVYEVGFPVRKRNLKKRDAVNLKYVTFTCRRAGRRSYGTSNSLKQQPTSQTDCKTWILTSLLSNGN